MKPGSDNPVCIECGLFRGCKSPFMSSSGAKNPRVLIIGEAPGEDEDKAGKPFVGRAGQLLRNVLGEVGVDEAEVRYTNTVRCRPPDNKITKKSIQACRSFAMVEVKHFHPEFVFLLGNTPLSGILGETGITNWNGSVVSKEIDDNTIKFVPLFHPAYLLYDPTHMEEWLGAMLNALEGEEDTPGKRAKIECVLPKTDADLSEMMAYLLQYDEIVFDLETTSLDAFSKTSQIVAVAFAAGNKAYAYPINHKDASSWWKESPYDLKDYAVKLTIKILSDKHGHLIGHNVKFDKIWADNIFKMDVDASGDTMLISHLLDSRAGIHGLKRLAGVYCNMYDYDAPLRDYIDTHADANPKRAGNYGNIPLDILLPYAAMDAKATIILNEQLLPKLTVQQKVLYDELIIPASNMLSRMQANGLTVDSFISHRYYHIYKHLQALEYEKLCNDKYVKKITKRKNKELSSNGKKKTIAYAFNPNSSLQLRELYFTCYKIPVLARSKKTDAPSTSGKVYVTLEKDYPILHTVRMFKMYNKALSTYLGPAMNGSWLSDDGLVHSTFNQHTVVTGRLSSSDPVNLQNMPAPEKEPGTVLEYLPIKNIFTHRDWWAWSGNYVDPAEIYDDIFDTGALVMFDQSGMELRVFASLAKCEPMLAIHKSGQDFHSMVAIMSLEHKYPDQIEPDYVKWFKKNKSEVRYRYKWTNWTLLYGGDAYTLHRLYDVPIIDAEETVKMYYELFPEVLEYRNWTQEFAEDNGYIESIFGRREYLPYITNSSDQGRQNQARRAAVNMPVQSTASDTVLASMVMIEKELRKQGFASKLVNTVHDSGVGDCPRPEIVTFARLAKDVMERVPEYAKTYMPNVDFSWLLCPLIADVDVGTHYGVHISLNEFIEKYESVGVVK